MLWNSNITSIDSNIKTGRGWIMNPLFALALVLVVPTTVYQTFVEGCGGCPSGGGPKPQDGRWSAWRPADWPKNRCSGPFNNARRECNSPPPKHGGKGCSGPSTQTAYCNECSFDNGGCQHNCVHLRGSGIRCDCYPGFKRVGSKKCSEITCARSELPSIRNGYYSSCGESKVKTGTICPVTCNRGYRPVVGSSYPTCGSGGRWNLKRTSHCQVKECRRLIQPDKGVITPEICKTKPVHGQKCYYKCRSGYQRQGPSSSSCFDGTWTQTAPFCVDLQAPSFGETCPKPRTVFADKGKNTATVAWAPVTATDNDPTAITVTARPDVTSPHEFSEGSHTVMYTAKDSSRNMNLCFFTVNVQVLRCSVFIPPENGRLISGTCGNVFGSVCRVQCNKGYILNGPITRTCDKIPGTNQVRWTENATVCEAMECPSLDAPDHAVKTGYACGNQTAIYGTSCFFNCMLGYEAVGGSRQRTCQENQQWSGTQLQCQAVKCTAAAAVKSEGLLVNPPVCTNSTAVHDYKNECRFTCKTGYRLQGPGLKTCAQSEEWVPLANPFCLDVLGPTFTNCPPDRVVTADRGTMSATVMWSPPKATDNSGFVPNVTHPRKGAGEKFLAGEHTIRYRATDKAGNIGECKFNILVTVVRCMPRLFAPAGGTKLCTKDNMYGSECSFTCHVGYNMVGSAKRVCEKNIDSSTGFWKGNETKCELVRCPRLQPPPHSVQSGCGAGASYNSFGDKCLLYCDIGYRQINGSSERVCQADGTWSGQAPYCEVVRCQALPAPNNGQVTPNSCAVSPEYGTTCHFFCRMGYRLMGAPVASCIRDGKWSQNTRRFCKDVESPSFGVTCPSDIKRFADRGKNHTTVNWNPVIATDNSGVAPNVTTSGVKSIYVKGKHLVMYKASDEAGNSKICKFHVSVLVLRCQRRPPPFNGFFAGDCDDSYGSKCRMSCDDGHNLVGAKDITCEARPGHIIGYWDKPMPICKVRKCSPLKSPVFGSIYPHMCTSSPVSGTTCSFECRHGFMDDGGVNATHCGKDGEWTRDESEILKCLDVTPPVFLSCPSDIRTSINVNSSALVNWKVPVAMDNSNIVPQITVSPPGVIPPYKFLNSTLIVYTAKDSSGNEEECSFKILLEDNLGPEVVYCPPDQNITVTKMKSVIRWKSPRFKDNSNSPLMESCSHKSGTKFYWGTWNVFCTAYDNNPNNKPAVCRFTLRLKPKDCKDLSPPKNGAKACDDWALGRMCSPFCNDKWDFTQPLPPFMIWSCGASGRWFPPMRWPDCTRVYQPNKARMAMDLYYFNGDCTSPKAQAEIKQNFVKILVGSIYREICQDDVYKDKCKADNVKVTCDLVPSVKSRKKRSLDDANLVHNGTQGSLIPQTTISLDIVVLLEGTGTDDTKEDKVTAGLMGVKIANNISSAIKKAVDKGSLSLNVNGTEFAADKESLNISEPERLCETGQAYRDGYCVSCSPGTYLNETLGTCEDCPVGTYQDQESQETCVLCPPKTSTEETRSFNLSDCLAMCKLGSYSPTGLAPCIPCEKGFFQAMDGQRLCIKCSLGTTTSNEGSSSSKQCGVPCPAGSFSPTGLAPCSLCSQRSFQPYNESRTCVPCPGTTVTDQPGSKSLQDCKEISKCESNPCKDNFACIDLIDDFLCTCQPGYTGKQCKINIDDCQDQPCLNGGRCHDLVNSYTCTCAQGYQGINCQDDVDECVSSPCSSNALCSNVPGGYNCQCKPGYTGRLCDTEIDECLVFPCQNGATCEDGINNYECRCAPGFQGYDCEENIDHCASNPCQNEAICMDGISEYHCICLAGFKGPNCEHNIDECAHSECKHNATCIDQVNGFYCVCQEGFSGKHCEVDIDECTSNPCMNQASRCENRINGYFCDCQDGFDGLQCENNIDDCASNPCSNNGSCHDSVNNFTCVCPTGFTGNTCSLDMDYCASMPCFNNASCFDGVTSFTCQCPDGFHGDQCQHNIDDCQNVRCSNGGTCIDGIDEYACICSPGFTGFNCEINIDECAQNPCLNEGTCTDMTNDFHCTCQSGYTGRNCSVNINECLSSPCQNNATCFDQVNTYTCACVDGFNGKHCEFDIDDCLGHSCVNGAKCKDGINSYTCICPPGYSGEHCGDEVDECESFPCLFGGTCYDKINGFYCGCRNGFTGQRCEVNIDDCQSKPCANDGICTDLMADYTCWCPSGYTGVHCENRIDYCKYVNCSQNGVCENLLEGFRCNCSSGYFGKYCEFDLDECSVEPCFNNATCHDAINSFTCSCTAGFTGRFCELNIDDCFHNSCQNNATCIDHTLGYSCLCADGYNGTYCQTEINECESNPCKNNGTCEDQTPGYKCKCLDGYTGGNCENLRDICVPFPCENGGSCLADNSTGTFTCLCKTGFTGKTCDVNIDDCASDPCMPNSYCDDRVNGYECKCYPTYTGDHCDIFLGTNFDLIFKRQNFNDMVIISDGEGIPTMRSFTIVMYVRADSKYKSGTLFSYSVPNEPNDTIILSYTESQVEISIKDETFRVNFALADDRWHYVGVVWDGIAGTVSVYIDGPEIEKKANVLTSDTISGGGWIVLGQRYLAGQNSSLLSTAFVGTLHQVNFWNVPGSPDHMWIGALNCTLPIAGTTRGWTSFLFGIKGNVEKRFMTQCKVSNECTRNCSHVLHCWSAHGVYYCNCQAGFTGRHCNINIDDCTLSPCVNGRCVDGINRYDCVCDKGYWGTNCENKIDNEGECPPLSDPKNGAKSCKNFSGRMDCTMTCDEGHAYDSETMTSFECGPDTGWKWNHMDHINVPACSSKAAPKEIRHRLLLGFHGIQCQFGKGFSSFRTAIEQTVTDTLSEIPGCLYADACKLKKVEVPGCGWAADQKKEKEKHAVTKEKDVLLSLSVKAVDSPKLTDDVEEKSEAVLFLMQYAVSTGQFKVILHGVNSTADRSSWKHLSSDITCNPGFVTSSDRQGCVACSVGTSYSQEFSTCTSCSRGMYQDEEGQLSCKPCGEGKTTNDFGAHSGDECFVEKENL